MIVDGQKIKDDILISLQKEISNLNQELKLAVFIVGQDSVIENFVKYKKKVAEGLGINFSEYRFSGQESNLEKLLITKIKEVAEQVQGIVIQLPLPSHLDTEKVLRAVPSEVDIDVLNGQEHPAGVLSPVTGAVWEILQRYKVNLDDKKILLVGSGRLVGRPTYEFLQDKCSEIAMIDLQTENKEEFYKQADIIISGAGVPSLIKPGMIKEGVVLIDAGTSTSQRKIQGDIDLSCNEKASVFAKTPGGVGPITIAILYRNLVTLAKQRTA